MRDIFIKGFHDFRRSYMKFLSFEFLYSLTVSIILAPFLTYIFNRILIIIKNTPGLFNDDALAFGLSFKGFLGFLLMSFIVVSVLFVEFGILIMIAHKTYFKKPIYLSDAILATFKKLPKLLSIGFFQLSFILLFFIPWIDVATFPSFFDMNVSIMFYDALQLPIYVKLFSIVIFIFSLYLFVRWIFSLHFIFLKNQSVWKAMKSSWRMTKHKQVKLIIYLVVLNVCIILFGIICMTLASQLVDLLNSKVITDFIGNYLMMIASFITILLSLFLIPINIIFLTRIYYKYHELFNEPIEDRLTFRRMPRLVVFEKKVERFLSKRRVNLQGAVVIVMTGIFFVNYITSEAVVYLPWHVQVAGHRGDGFHAPENTMVSIKNAVEKGIDVVEVDVTMTKDEVLILHHDATLQRTAGVPSYVRDLTYDELKNIDVGRRFDDAFAGEKIPTLDEVLDFMKEEGASLLIDVKINEDEENFAEKLVQLIEAHDAFDIARVQSFNYRFLQAIRSLNEEIKIGQILFLAAGSLSRLDVDFYTIRQTMLTERFMEQAKRDNREVWVWTVNSPRQIKEVLNFNIDGIITDYPERVYQLLQLN